MPKPLARPGPRKVRKGTKSCWECRGRKVKCIFLSSGPGDAVCEGCMLRGSKCVSQELPEQPLAKVDRRVPLRNRMLRLEQLLGSLVREVPGTGLSQIAHLEKLETIRAEFDHLSPQLSAGELGPVDVLLPAVSQSALGDSSGTNPSAQGPSSMPQKYQTLSKELLMVFPPEESVKLVVKLAGLVPPFFHQIAPKTPGQSVGFSEMEKQNLIVELVTRHTHMTHPLVIVRQMLLLAIGFRYIHPASHQSLARLPGWPGDAMRRMGDAAIALLERRDSMIETPEGLECLLLASSLHADSGNLRSAWSTTRRAMLLAQLQSLNRQTRVSVRPLQSGNTVTWDPSLLWYRIIFFDRFFSLALGLPQGSTDNPMGEGNLLSGHDSPLWSLQRKHCAVAGEILQRNESNSLLKSLDETTAIDHELQLAAQSMPARWWLVPNLASIVDDWELYQATLRLTEQVFHDILLTQLHLPLMLQPTSPSCLESQGLSLLACVNASRDLLHRYMALRNFSNVSYCCHSMDFFAVTASVILLLGSMHDHRSRSSGKTLGHQRASDRAIMDEILVNMAQTGTLDKASALSERGASVLGRLLNIEQRVWESSRLGVRPAETDNGQPSVEQALHLIVPCLGILRVKPTGEVQITGDGITDVTVLAPDVTVSPATAHSKNRQPGIANQASDCLALDTSCFANFQSTFVDQDKQLDALVADAHTAFLTSVMEDNGEFQGSADTESWWLL
ncbi:hypothetical protein QBC37DRAFT_421621 [Rhypophila decipiens]|uniref:Zn(2)-C6 fungal-type domain-containing protein n=1 Tax=Rhypophila decipiens TaxID=261697 RepID=A0AAN7B8T5_9PEZI|nr:hypothetical protein QBC37DRAFT_421621 [Rhypophila decipiens]